MFSPTHWDSYCSETGHDVNCVGLLLVRTSLCKACCQSGRCVQADAAFCGIFASMQHALYCSNQEEEDGYDKELLAMRSYIIKRCSRPVAIIFGDENAQQV